MDFRQTCPWAYADEVSNPALVGNDRSVIQNAVSTHMSASAQGGTRHDLGARTHGRAGRNAGGWIYERRVLNFAVCPNPVNDLGASH